MQLVANTRNFLMHLNFHGNKFDSSDLPYATEILRTLVTMWLYREIGIPPVDVATRIKQHPNLSKILI